MAREAENRNAWPMQEASPRQACVRLFPQGWRTRRKRSSVQLPGGSELHSSRSRLYSRRTMNRVERHDDFVCCYQLSEPAAASEALRRQTCSSRCRPSHLRFRRHHTDHSGQQRATKALAAGRCGLIHQRDGWSGCQRPCEARRKRFYNGGLPPREGCLRSFRVCHSGPKPMID